MEELTKQFPCNPPAPQPLIESLLDLRADLLRKEQDAAPALRQVHPRNLRSARNLLHYLAFRTHDLRELQLQLSAWGLSSLGRLERKVQATIDTVLQVLHQLTGQPWQPAEQPPFCYHDGRQQLEINTEMLLGKMPGNHRVRIMVTMPSEAANDPVLVNDLLLHGMDCARINCAHDDAETWARIVANIRLGEKTTGRTCKILMDLGGPKLRTGSLEPLPAALKVRPQRNTLGEVVAPAQVWLFAEGKDETRPPEADVALPMPADWLKQLKKGDRIELTDARGSQRRLKVRQTSSEGCLLTVRKTIYFRSGLALRIVRKKGKKVKNEKARLIVELPTRPNGIRLQPGDLLRLTRSQVPGHPAKLDEQGNLDQAAAIACSLPEVFDDVQLGEPVWFDDGKIGGTIEGADDEALHVRITQTPPGGGVLRSEKGINLPETELQLRALSDQDKQDLEFVVRNADMVGLSFANRPSDVEELLAHMRSIRPDIPAVVLKIETRLGFDNLPAMLLALMAEPVGGVMIARGDLAIECGFGRLAEVQEQVLWVCEAAHVPVIWATQVLEGLAKQGLPTRAEVTDAAMGQRAECIMLNKGEHIVEAARALGDILSRMQDHQTKKRSMLRKLHLATHFFNKHSQPRSAESTAGVG